MNGLQIGDTVKVHWPNHDFNNYEGRVMHFPAPERAMVLIEGFSKAGNAIAPIVPVEKLEPVR